MKIKNCKSDPNEEVKLMPAELTKEQLSEHIWALNGLRSGIYQLTSGPEKTKELVEETSRYLKSKSQRSSDSSSENE